MQGGWDDIPPATMISIVKSGGWIVFPGGIGRIDYTQRSDADFTSHSSRSAIRVASERYSIRH
jgi:hypothetical protein